MSKLIPAALLANLINLPEDQGFIIGEPVFIRTVTYHTTGRVEAVRGGFVILSDAAWIPDSGRFMDAIETGTLAECEPVTTPVRVAIATIVDVFHWKHALPRDQK